jgi:hypothetical protein
MANERNRYRLAVSATVRADDWPIAKEKLLSKLADIRHMIQNADEPPDMGKTVDQVGEADLAVVIKELQ